MRRLSEGSDCERVAAATALLGVGILELESLAVETVREVEDCACEKDEGLLRNVDQEPVLIDDLVIRIRAINDLKNVLEPRTSASGDSHLQSVLVFAIAQSEFGNFRRRLWRDVNGVDGDGGMRGRSGRGSIRSLMWPKRGAYPS